MIGLADQPAIPLEDARNALDNADRRLFRVQHRALFDVQFQKGLDRFGTPIGMESLVIVQPDGGHGIHQAIAALVRGPLQPVQRELPCQRLRA